MSTSLENDLTHNVYLSLQNASRWILNNFENSSENDILDYNDLDGITYKISALYTIADTGNLLKCDANYPDIIKKRTNDTEICDIWIEYYIDKIQLRYIQYLKRYFELLLNKDGGIDWHEDKYIPIWKSCGNCPDNYVCLDLFKATLSSVFTKKMVLNPDSIMSIIFDSTEKKLKEILKTLLNDENGKIFGFPHTIRNKNEISAYNSILILKFLKDMRGELWITNDRYYEIEKSIIDSIIKLQNDKTEYITRELIGDNIDLKGSWWEYLWGKKYIRMKSTSTIASTLYEFNYNNKVINRTSEFCEKLFDKKPYIVDLVDSRDKKFSDISDISGTISALKFYLNVGKMDLKYDEITAPLTWIIQQQDAHGYFPVLSSELLKKKYPIKDSELNVSLPNTVDAISLFSLFLKKKLEDRK